MDAHDQVLEGMAAQIAEHLRWMRTHDYAPGTIEKRKWYLEAFAAWCAERGLARAQEVSRTSLEGYQRHVGNRRNQRTGERLGASSRFRYLISVKLWFDWLAKQNQLLFNPAAGLELPRREARRLPSQVLSASEADQIMNQVDTDRPAGIRDRAILEVLYSTGLRRAEVARLKLDQLDLEQRTVFVLQGKGRKDRFVPIGKRAVRWLERYIEQVRAELVADPNEQAIFLNRWGEPLSTGHLTQMAGRYVRAAGLGKRGACHLFRHTMATLMLENGADVRFIQQMLGHENLSTTQIYTRVSIRKLREVHAATHPSAGLGRYRKPADEDLDLVDADPAIP